MRFYVGALILALLAFVTLALLVRGGAGLAGIDRPIITAVQAINWPPCDWVLRHVSDFGYMPGNLIVYVLVFAALAAAGDWPAGVLAVASSLCAGLVGGEIKTLVGRLRPSGAGIHITGHLSGYSFPSGHVTQYTTLFGFAFYVVLTTWRGGMLRHVVLALLGLLVLLVGPSRIYLGAHWPSDVFGAYLFAGLWLAGTTELHLFVSSRLDGALERRSSKRIAGSATPRR